MQWLVAALNSVEPFTIAWLLAKAFDRNPAQAEVAAGRMNPRLARLAAVLDAREWLAGGRLTGFSSGGEMAITAESPACGFVDDCGGEAGQHDARIRCAVRCDRDAD